MTDAHVVINEGVGKKLTCPAQTAISIRPNVILFDERYFTNPHDFIPERWLPKDQQPSEYAGDVLSASQPFSVGPTNCLGRPLAWAEMRLVLARIFWYFEVSLVPERPFSWESQKMLMTVEKDPLWLALKPRHA